jgi:hypothetical protein
VKGGSVAGFINKEGHDNFFLHLTGGSVPEYFLAGWKSGSSSILIGRDR